MALKRIGTTTKVHKCGHCGKRGLARTVVFQRVDRSMVYLGSDCAKNRGSVARADRAEAYGKGRRMPLLSEGRYVVNSQRRARYFSDREEACKIARSIAASEYHEGMHGPASVTVFDRKAKRTVVSVAYHGARPKRPPPSATMKLYQTFALRESAKKKAIAAEGELLAHSRKEQPWPYDSAWERSWGTERKALLARQARAEAILKRRQAALIARHAAMVAKGYDPKKLPAP